MTIQRASRIPRCPAGFRRPIAALLLFSLFWTLTLAPALAALRTVTLTTPTTQPTPAAPDSTEAIAAEILGGEEKLPEDTAHCACLKCGSAANCCCKPAEAKAETSAPYPLCAFRAVCDQATAAISLPFLWWTALLPTAAEFVPPTPQGISPIAVPVMAAHAPAELAVPETPPRLS